MTTPSLDATGDDAGVKEKATASAQAGKEAVADVAQTATDNAKDVAREAQQQAKQVLDQAQGQLRDHAREQHRNAVTNLRTLGDELTSMSQQSDQQGIAADVVAQAGSRASSAASWLDQREPGDLADEVRRFARQRPGVFLLGALAAGVLAGRLTRGVVAVHRDDAADDSVPAATADSAGHSTDYSTGPTTTPMSTPVVPAGGSMSAPIAPAGP